MARVSSRELRNDTAGIIRRVHEGQEIIITVRGEPAAELIPLRSRASRWLPKPDLIRLLREASSDPDLKHDLDILAGDTTEDLGPIG